MSGTFSHIDWDRYADSYDALTELSPYTRMLDDILHCVESFEKAPLLDAGCGTGNLIHALVKRQVEGRITGIDSSPAMLDRARAKCGTSADIREADLNAPLPFSDASFGTITCINALYAVNRPQDTLRELYRVLAQHGALIIATPKNGYENGLILKAHCGSKRPDEYWLDAHRTREREEKLLREAIDDEALLQRMLFVAEANRHIAQNVRFHFFTKEYLYQIVEDAGFTITGYRETYTQQTHLVIATKP